MSHSPDQAPSHVSIENQMPEDLFRAMRDFIRLHPQWDQYRLMQAALAGFLFQHGCNDRAVARHYLDGLFQRGPGPGAVTAPGAVGVPAAPITPIAPIAPLAPR